MLNNVHFSQICITNLKTMIIQSKRQSDRNAQENWYGQIGNHLRFL